MLPFDSAAVDAGSAGDAEFRALADVGNLQAAASRFMEQHGGEILAFLALRLRDHSAASEVFSEFALDFWRGFARFRWRTSLRSWAYTLARNAANRYRLSQRRTDARFSHPHPTPDCPEAPRSSTAPYLRTEVKRRMRSLRDQLPADDRALLVLRIDQGLCWNELAVIFSGAGEALEEGDMLRWAARLRQRFNAIKRRLRTQAEAEGLI